MNDPNVTYKRDYEILRESLGRHPTANELLPLHDAYKRTFEERKCVSAVHAKELSVATTERGNAVGSAAGPSAPGFSREPAPQARTGQVARESVAGPPQRLTVAAAEPLSATDKGEAVEEPVSEPRAGLINPRPSEAAPVATRGPGGGVLAVCRACGREFERPVVKGRPPVKCEGCR